MLPKQITVILISLIALLPQLTIDAKPLHGRKRAFGFGMLTGALAGAAAGHVISHHHQKPKQLENTNTVTTIQKDAIMSNGCYKQTVKEPDTHDSRKMIETVHLICPPGIQAVQTVPVASVVQIPVAPAANVVPVIQVPMGPAAPIPVAHPPQTYSINNAPVVQTQQPYQQQQQQQQHQPVYITSNIATNQPVTPQVFVLSKKSVLFKKNAADNVLKANFIMILIVASILFYVY